MTPFGTRLAQAMREHGPLCVGIDPHTALLRAWGLTDDVAGLRAFAGACVVAFGGHVAAVKPQSAFFERHGSAGVAVLEDTIAGLRAAGTLTIVDAKRGDIGSTMAAYADAFVGDDSPLAGDAVTVSAYLGFGSLRPVLDLAATGRGVFVLGLTSNPEGPSVQHARGADGTAVAAGIVAAVAAENAAAGDGGEGEAELGSVGLVIGATVGSAVAELGIDLAASRAPLLAPGVGAQGATAADLREVFGAARAQVLAASSREVLGAGPDVSALRAAARASAASVRAALAD